MSDNDSRIIMPGAQQRPQQQLVNPMVMFQQMQQVIQKLQEFYEHMRNLEQGIIGLSQEVQAHALGLKMVFDMFVTKGLFTVEEVKQLTKENIDDPMREAMENLQQQMQAAAQAQQEAMEAAQQAQQQSPQQQEVEKKIDVKEETKTEESAEDDSSVVLASERFNNVPETEDETD